MNKLKPCPFCGEKAEYGYTSVGPVNSKPIWEHLSVDCTGEDCHASVTAPTLPAARKMWNRRE